MAGRRKTGPMASASDCSKQPNVAFVLARRLGMGHRWQAVLVHTHTHTHTQQHRHVQRDTSHKTPETHKFRHTIRILNSQLPYHLGYTQAQRKAHLLSLTHRHSQISSHCPGPGSPSRPMKESLFTTRWPASPCPCSQARWTTSLPSKEGQSATITQPQRGSRKNQPLLSLLVGSLLILRVPIDPLTS